jgi:hypothetical protein
MSGPYQKYVDRHIIPILGSIKVNDVTRADIAKLMKRLEYKPVGANRVLACLRKMFNMAEVWGYRADGSNPCRHIPKYPESAGRTRLIIDEELALLFAYLDRADAEGLEHPFLTLGIRLHFQFAARMSESSISNGHGSISPHAGLPGRTVRQEACRSH